MKKRRVILKILSLISIIVFFASCVTKTEEKKPTEVKVEPPKGFATQQDDLADDEILKAISYTGVSYRVRKIPNQDQAKLKFWRESFEKHLTDSGYIFQKRTRVKSKNAKAAHVTFIAPTATADYRYSFTMIVNNDWIVVAEAAGLADDYDPVAKDVQRAARRITL